MSVSQSSRSNPLEIYSLSEKLIEHFKVAVYMARRLDPQYVDELAHKMSVHETPAWYKIFLENVAAVETWREMFSCEIAKTMG